MEDSGHHCTQKDTYKYQPEKYQPESSHSPASDRHGGRVRERSLDCLDEGGRTQLDPAVPANQPVGSQVCLDGLLPGD
jgi:hypothetical protein